MWALSFTFLPTLSLPIPATHSLLLHPLPIPATHSLLLHPLHILSHNRTTHPHSSLATHASYALFSLCLRVVFMALFDH